MSRRMPQWLRRKKTAAELPLEPPIRLGNMSNGEFFHQSTPQEQRIRAEILRQADEKARKLNMDRRDFLSSAMGMATSLSVLNLAAACSSSATGEKNQGFIDMGRGGSGGNGLPPSFGGSMAPASATGGVPGTVVGGPAGMQGIAMGGGGQPGFGGMGVSSQGSAGSFGGGGMGSGGVPGGGGAGGYNVPPRATMDCAMAEELLNGKGEFIMDCQTHHIEHEGDWRNTNPGQDTVLATYFAQYNMCDKADLTMCIDAQSYLEQIFLNSDTTLAVLSGFPAPLCTETRTTGCGNPLDNDAMWKSREQFNMLGNSQRVINHCQVNPTDNLPKQLALMERIKKEHNCWGFKSYPEWGPDGRGWMLDDPSSGIKMIEKAIELDSKIICVHKGIVFPGWDRAASTPKDVGIVAKMYPDVAFVVYHSAIEIDGTGEGPYDPNNTMGTDRLCRAAEENMLMGKNMYAELGSCWAQVMNAPDKAQHVIGKLLKYLGPDNIVWGSECVWLGSPQAQIEAFRVFQITKEYQDKYGYPELTQEAKAKIFGLNAARIYKINPDECRYKIKQTKLAMLKQHLDGEMGGRRWAFNLPGGPRTRREFWNLAKLTGGKPGV
jgi:predicted TIM-barrel fold metal-dependent hydrolase